MFWQFTANVCIYLNCATLKLQLEISKQAFKSDVNLLQLYKTFESRNESKLSGEMAL